MVAEGRDTDKITYPQPGREKGGIVNEKIKNITFENICFQHNTFLRPGTEDGYVGTQGDTLSQGRKPKEHFPIPGEAMQRRLTGQFMSTPETALYFGAAVFPRSAALRLR